MRASSIGAKLLIGMIVALMLAGCGRRDLGAPVTYGTPPYKRVADTSGLGGDPIGQAIIVRSGDTLSGIAKRYDVGMGELASANGLSPPYPLKPGQRLRLPRLGYHEVRPGETLWGISRMYKMEPRRLAEINHLTAADVIRPGQKLQLDEGTASAETTPRVRPTQYASVGRPDVTPRPREDAARWTAPKPKAAPAAYHPGAPSLTWPARGRILSDYGPKSNGMRNDGINIGLEPGTPIVSAGDGVVTYTGADIRQFGNLVLVRHDDSWVTAYAHAETILVRRGQRVARGQKIATAGKTGAVTSPQLHFEIRKDGKPVDPRANLGR